MNELQHELELLTRATAPGDAPCLPPEPELAELREGWQALARLAARHEAERPLNEAAFLANVSAAVRLPPAGARRGWLGALGALAASLLVCLVAVGYVASRPWWGSVGWGNAAAGPSALAPDEAGAPHVARSFGSAELSWEDSLDEQIADLHAACSMFAAPAPSGDRSLQALGAQLWEFGQDIDNGSL